MKMVSVPTEKGEPMIAIPIDKPERGEVIALDGENAVYSDDDMNVHRYPIIDIVMCKDCKRSGTDGENTFCMWLGALRKPTDFCSYGERRVE